MRLVVIFTNEIFCYCKSVKLCDRKWVKFGKHNSVNKYFPSEQ